MDISSLDKQTPIAPPWQRRRLTSEKSRPHNGKTEFSEEPYVVQFPYSSSNSVVARFRGCFLFGVASQPPEIGLVFCSGFLSRGDCGKWTALGKPKSETDLILSITFARTITCLRTVCSQLIKILRKLLKISLGPKGVGE